MSADYTHYDYQFRQRLTGTSLNVQEAWVGRLTPELLRRLIGDREIVSGVVSGLKVNGIANTLQSAVSGGLGVLYDSTKVAPDSQHRWIEVTDGAPLVVTHDPGDANPRWDVVEIAPGLANAPGEMLDVYNPNTGAFVPTALSPLKLCTPVVTIRKGTPAASPKLPAGTTGVIPLAYVYIAANAVQVNVDRYMRCRPLIISRSGIYSGEAVDTPLVPTYTEAMNIQGGGVVMPADGVLSGELYNTMTGRFANGGLPFCVFKGTNIGLSAVGNYKGGGLPGASNTVYFFVAPPPYPAGYDAHLAARELFINDFATPGINATIPAGARNCILVGTSSDPSVSALGNQGAPHVLDAFIDNGIFGNFSLRRSEMYYVGAAFYDTGLPGFVAQRMSGNWVGPKRKTGWKFDGALPIVAPTLNFVTGEATGDPNMGLPGHVRRVGLVISATVGPPSSWFYIELLDQFETQGSNIPRLTWAVNSNSNDIDNVYSYRQPAVLDDSGMVAIVQADGGLLGDCYLHVYEYEDAILALR